MNKRKIIGRLLRLAGTHLIGAGTKGQGMAAARTAALPVPGLSGSRTKDGGQKPGKVGRIMTNAKRGHFLWKISGEFIHLLNLSLVVCLSDQLLKNSIDTEPEENFPRELPHSGGYVKVMRAHNPGFSMGRLGDHPEFVKLSSLAATGFLAGSLHYLTTEYPGKYPLRKMGMALVIGGAMSNVADRARKGKVTDYINIRVGSFKKAIVNIGDLAIYAGGALYLLGAVKGLLFGEDD